MVTCTLPVRRGDYAGKALTITVEGLQGGHSGVEINKGRGNANILMGRVLYAVSRATRMRLVSVEGGGKDNAIPLCAVAHVVVRSAEKARAACAEVERALQGELCVTDPGVRVTVTEGEKTLAMDSDSTRAAIAMLMNVPNGVQVMSADVEGLVQTSLNLGILTTEDRTVTAIFSVRSSVESQKEMLWDRLRCLMDLLGGTVEVSGNYPGWAYRQDSPLRDVMTEVFTEQYGHAPKIEAIHAGLECGLFAGKLPGLDCISFGPDLKEIHTSRETMSVSSVRRVWAMVTEVLRRMK
jgi:dipeptidase D